MKCIPSTSHRVARVLLSIYLLVLAWAVLTPGEQGEGHWLLVLGTQVVSSWGIDDHIAFEVVEFSANIALFIPLGVLLPLSLPQPRRFQWLLCSVAGLGLSLTIEFAQWFIPGRVSDARDLLSNTIGAVLGAVLFWLVCAVRSDDRSHGAPQQHEVTHH